MVLFVDENKMSVKIWKNAPKFRGDFRIISQ